MKCIVEIEFDFESKRIQPKRLTEILRNTLDQMIDNRGLSEITPGTCEYKMKVDYPNKDTK